MYDLGVHFIRQESPPHYLLNDPISNLGWRCPQVTCLITSKSLCVIKYCDFFTLPRHYQKVAQTCFGAESPLVFNIFHRLQGFGHGHLCDHGVLLHLPYYRSCFSNHFLKISGMCLIAHVCIHIFAIKSCCSNYYSVEQFWCIILSFWSITFVFYTLE